MDHLAATRADETVATCGTALAVIESDNGLVELPDLGAAAATIAELVNRQEGETLDEIRRRAEAAKLYERRSGNAERERHFGKLRLLAEAGIGSLSFDDPSVIEVQYVRTTWRALGAAFERNVLLELAEKSTDVSHVASEARQRGYTRAVVLGASKRWSEARRYFRENGIDPTTIPPDKQFIKRLTQNAQEASRRMQRAHAARERLYRIKTSKTNERMAQTVGNRSALAYSLLRKTLQALHEAQSEFGPNERLDAGPLEMAFTYLYRAEDALTDALRCVDNRRAQQRLLSIKR